MLVREIPDGVQIVMQTEHGRISGRLAAEWDHGDSLGEKLRAALDLAAARHDDGWAVWEQAPRVRADGRPQSFLDGPVEPLLSSYSACVDVVADESPLAGLLVSMHVSGLRRGRYGVFAGEPAVAAEELQAPVREFVRREEARQRELAAGLGVAELRWPYRLLQIFDVISLHLGLADLSCEERTIAGPPEDLTAAGTPEAAGRPITLSPGPSPWSVVIEPYPFRTAPLRVTMSRRVLPGRRWDSDAELREAFRRAPAEGVEVLLAPAGAAG